MSSCYIRPTCLSLFKPGKIRFSLFKKSSTSIKPHQDVLTQADQVCRLYDACFQSLKGDVKTDILIGLGCHGGLVSKMWHFLWLTLRLDVDKIVQAAGAAVVAKKSLMAAKGRLASSVGFLSLSSSTSSPDVQDPASVFGLLNMCCQTTQCYLA